MDIKCAALVLVLLTVTMEFTETLPPLCANCLKASPEGIMTGKVANIQKRQKKSLKDADINLDEVFASELADKLHSRHKRGVPPRSPGIMTMNVKLQSGMRKRQKKSLKDADINLNEFLASGLADLINSRKRVPQEGKMTRKNTRLHSEVGKGEQRSVEDADMNLDEYLASGLADKPLNRHKRLPPQRGIIMTTNNVKLHSEVRKREKRSLKDADMYLDEVFASELADKLHSRDKRGGPPISAGIMTMNVKLQSEMQKRKKKSLKDSDINLNDFFASGLADKLHSRDKRVPQEGKMTRKNTRLHSEVGKREQRSVEDADMNLDEYFPLGLADKLNSRYRRIPPPGRPI